MALELARAGFAVAIVTFAKDHVIPESVERSADYCAANVTRANGRVGLRFPNGGRLMFTTAQGARGLSVDAVLVDNWYAGVGPFAPMVATSKLGLVVAI